MQQEQCRLHNQQHDKSPAAETIDVAPVHARVAIYDSEEAEQGIENADAGEVIRGSEMGDALFAGRVIDTDGDRNERNVRPSGEDQQLEFRLVARGEQ